MFSAHGVSDPSTIHHIGLYVGDGQMIESPHTGAFVRYTAIQPRARPQSEKSPVRRAVRLIWAADIAGSPPPASTPLLKAYGSHPQTVLYGGHQHDGGGKTVA